MPPAPPVSSLPIPPHPKPARIGLPIATCRTEAFKLSLYRPLRFFARRPALRRARVASRSAAATASLAACSVTLAARSLAPRLYVSPREQPLRQLARQPAVPLRVLSQLGEPLRVPPSWVSGQRRSPSEPSITGASPGLPQLPWHVRVELSSRRWTRSGGQ